MEEENKVVEPKKKSPVGVIILVIILMVGCLAGGYYISEKGLIKIGNKETKEAVEKETEEVTEPEVTNYEVTDAKVANLIGNLTKIGMADSSCWAVENYAKDTKVLSTDISNLIVYHVVEINEFYNKKDSFTLDEFNKAVKKYFYGDIKFDPTTIDYKGASCPQYSYDSNTKTFTKQQTACGGTCGPVASYKITKAVDTDGTLELDAKVIFVEYNNNKGYDYFSDYNNTNGIGKFGDDVNTLLDKGSNYKFTFKLVDGNYAYVSSEPVK